jgi:hypothetical protein
MTSIHRPFGVLALVLAVAWSMHATAVDRTVGSSGTYATIQEAIDVSGDGDRVIVSEGIYLENIDFKGKSVIITSVDPDDSIVVSNTVIDGRQLAPVVLFQGSESSTAKLTGFTITNGRSDGRGGGILGNGAQATIERCIIRENIAASDGGGIASIAGTIRGNRIYENVAVQGGGIFGCGGTIEQNYILANEANDGGGISQCPGMIRNNVVAFNEVLYTGGGILGCNGSILNNTLYGNIAGSEGGGLSQCNGVITNCIIWANTGAVPQLYASADPTYSCIQDDDTGGNGNIDEDPLLRDPANGDFHLPDDSPCLDAGKALAEVTDDLDGEARPYDAVTETRGDGSGYDIGADEFIITYYTLKTSVQGTGTLFPAPGTSQILSGTEITLTATPSIGWVFSRWEGDLTGSTNPITFTMNANKSIKAVFVQQIQRVLNMSVTGTGTVDPSPGNNVFLDGTDITLTATPAPGWVFLRWEGAVTGSENPTSLLMDANYSVRAVFARASNYTLTMSVMGAGTTSPAPGSTVYAENSKVTLAAYPASGWVFDHWEGAVTGSQNPANITVNSDLAVTAVFVQNPKRLTLNVVGNGSLNLPPGTYTYNAGTQITLTAYPAVGWKFAGWQGSLTGDQNPASLLLDIDRSVTAVFVTAEYALTIETRGEGQMDPEPGVYIYGAGVRVRLNATPEPGWMFSHWEGDISGSTNPLDYTMSADRLVRAVFEPIRYTLNTAVKGRGRVHPSDEQTFEFAEFTQVPVTATPDVGWRFSHWEGDLRGTDNPGILEIEKNSKVTAVFAPESIIGTPIKPRDGMECAGAAAGVITGGGGGSAPPWTLFGALALSWIGARWMSRRRRMA